MSFKIETERLILRDVHEDDIPTLVAIFAERESRKNILSRQADENYNKRNLETGIAWARTTARREHYVLSVELKTDRTLIGNCSISYVEPEYFNTRIGWHYGHQYRGNGYATEAARELLYIGFKIGNVMEIHADCFDENIASIRVMEKIGMQADWNFGLMKFLRGMTYGENKPAVRFKISKPEWLAQTNHRRQ